VQLALLVTGQASEHWTVVHEQRVTGPSGNVTYASSNLKFFNWRV
jgi:hypothetical protein